MTEHPTEVARRALQEAALVEGGECGLLMIQCAAALPRRHPLPEPAPAPKVLTLVTSPGA